MAQLQQFHAKICYTASGILIHEDRVLLVKHKKLGIWLNPGGHIEPDELAHQAAEREFFEETGVRVKAIDLVGLYDESDSEYLPNPIDTNLHWISKENYWARRQDKAISDEKWKKGCEQHLNFQYLVQPIANVDARANTEETTDMGWFTEAEIEALEDMPENIRKEVRYGFFLMSRYNTGA